jgi:putative tricarboxylic transport membrane protein
MKQDSRAVGVIAGLVLAILAALIAWSTSQMQVAAQYAKVGPQVFPYVAAVALAILGACFIIQSLTESPDKLEADTDETDWQAIGLIILGFIFEILFIKTLGFILSSTVLFWAVALAFGSRRYLRDLGMALIVSATAYFVFTKLLNLQLPAGIFRGLI